MSKHKKESNAKIQNAIREVSKGDCIVMGDFNHGNIQWDTLESTGFEDQPFVCLIQDNCLIQHVLEPTRGGRVLYLVLSSQKEFADNVKIQEPLGSSDHNQLHFNIKIKSDKTKVSRCKRNFSGRVFLIACSMHSSCGVLYYFRHLHRCLGGTAHVCRPNCTRSIRLIYVATFFRQFGIDLCRQIY